MAKVQWSMTEKTKERFVVVHNGYTVTVDLKSGVIIEQEEEGVGTHRVMFSNHVEFLEAMRALDRVVTGTYGDID